MRPNFRSLKNKSCASIYAWQQTGFSLIEVLVSIVVLSFGLLGMVGMQAAALQANREARLQSSAVVLAGELAELIRGNKAVGLATTATANPYLGSYSSPLVATDPRYCLNVSTGTAPCTGTVEIARAQMTEWLARVDSQLPGARIDVCFDSAPFDSNGLPQWACTSGAGGLMVVKLGWTRGSTNRSLSIAAAASAPSAIERAIVPSIVLPVTAGSNYSL